MLPLAEGNTMMFQTTAASDGLYWVKPGWFRYFGDSVTGGLEAIIDCHFRAANSCTPLKPIFPCNRDSLDDNAAAIDALISIITQ